MVKVLPMTPDDPMPDLEEWLAALRAMGPMEFDASERELIAETLMEFDQISKAAMITAWHKAHFPADPGVGSRHRSQ